MAKLKLSRYCVIAFACTTIAGCAVGPDYQRPDLPESKGYGTPTEVSVTGTRTASQLEGDQRLAVGADIRNDWWTLFRSPALNTLIEQAFAASPTIEIAQQALNVAQ